MAVLTTQFQEALKPVIMEGIDTTLKDIVTVSDEIFNVRSTESAYDDDLKWAGPGMAQVQREMSLISYDDLIPHYSFRYQSVTFALGMRISREAMSDFKVNILRSPIERLTRSHVAAREQHAMNVFNNGFDPAYVYGDGSPLFSSTHIRADGATASNVLATAADLSVTSLQDAITLMLQTKDDRGNPIDYTPSILLVSPANWANACEILESEGRAGTADRTINAIRTRYSITPIVSRHLTDADAWFLLAPKTEHKLKLMDREKPTPDTGKDIDTGAFKTAVYSRFIAGASDWRGVIGTPGA